MVSQTNAAALAAQFPSLSHALHSSVPLVGIYFAAAWCDDSTPATLALSKLAPACQDRLHVVYVSSDCSKEQMEDYTPPCVSAVPFENEQERADLKRTFEACGAKEMESLGMTAAGARKYGLPTLIVLDRSTGVVLTTKGAEDMMMDDGDTAIDRWMARRQL